MSDITKKTVSLKQAKNASRKSQNNIQQLCAMVNVLHASSGGKGLKVREEDWIDQSIVVQSFIEAHA
jgi:hypothetical protein